MPAVGNLDELQTTLGYHFQDSTLLQRALTHSSHAHEQRTGEDNEQLEFLGDAVLGFVVSDSLCRQYPTFTEGELSKLKGFFVSSANLVRYAEKLDLGRYLHLGKGEEKTGGRKKQALLVDALEAILGAIYLDSGLDAPKRIIERLVGPQIAEIGQPTGQFTDFKSALQEWLQARSKGPCQYLLANEVGPAHQKLFTIQVELGGDIIAEGIGLTKRAAEQAAAKQALEDLKRNGRRDIQEVDSTRVL
jgi:ribonuclease III